MDAAGGCGLRSRRARGPARPPWAMPSRARAADRGLGALAPPHAMHARHALVDGGAVLHARDAAAEFAARARYRRRAARLPGPDACARLPAARPGAGDRHLAQRRSEAATTIGASAIAGTSFTDQAGAFRFETIRPVRYSGRTPHIHVKVQGEATRVLTTQVFFPDMQEANARDRIFRDELVMRLDRAGGAWRGRFDFVLRAQPERSLRPRGIAASRRSIPRWRPSRADKPDAHGAEEPEARAEPTGEVRRRADHERGPARRRSPRRKKKQAPPPRPCLRGSTPRVSIRTRNQHGDERAPADALEDHRDHQRRRSGNEHD